jgi:hypothetical protein
MQLVTSKYEHNGYVRRTFDDGAYWTLDWVFEDATIEQWQYDVARYPFVPDYHIIQYECFDNDDDDHQETIISTHKTLAEALSIVRVLLASGGIKYEP